MKTLKVFLLSLIMGLSSVCLADSSDDFPPGRVQGLLCGLVRAIYYEQGPVEAQTAEVTLQSSEDSIKVIDEMVSRAVLRELGEDEEEMRMPGFIRRITALSDQLFQRHLQVCLEDVLIYDELEDGVFVRAGYIDSDSNSQVRIIEL